MRKTQSGLIYSQGDLVQFMESPYASWMERLHLENPDKATPDPISDEDKLAMQLGSRYEKKYLEDLKARGETIYSVADSADPAVTLSAMREGKALIYQGTLAFGEFMGRPDLLVRATGKSKLGDFHYTIRDTKLARSTKPHYIIQMCVYANLLEQIQGIRPERYSVVLGTGEDRWYRTDDFFYYYLSLKESFLEWMKCFNADVEPLPDLGGEYGRWAGRAEAYFRKVDHLSLTANITQLQVKRLETAGITTLADLAKLKLTSIARVNSGTLSRLHEQAEVQVESRDKGKIIFRIVKPSPESPRSGLALLPPESIGDINFDMEGFPYLEEGREYLFGAIAAKEGTYRDWWGHDADGEHVAFEGFVDWAHGMWKKHPDMHIYHYAAYEVSALRRLMGRHGTREQEVDDLLRNEVFVDIFTVVRGGMRIGTETYKLKQIEPLYWAGRDGAVKSAVDSMVVYQQWLDSGQSAEWKESSLLKRIREYNSQDCESLCSLVVWLRKLQKESGIHWVSTVETVNEAKEPKAMPKPGKVTREDRSTLAATILKELPSERDRAVDKPKWILPEMFGYTVEFHRREDKPAWWSLFDHDAAAARGDYEELVDGLDCIGDLYRDKTRKPESIKLSTGFWYKYDADQDTKLEEGDKAVMLPDTSRGFTELELYRLDPETGDVCIKIGPKPLSAFPNGEPPEHCGLASKGIVNADVIADSIFECAKNWHASRKIQPALEDYLRRRPPRIKGSKSGAPLVGSGEDAAVAALRVAPALDSSCLYIQGPPGSGKTTIGARLIVELAKGSAQRSVKIGVSGNSHKVIINLLEACLDEAAKQEFKLAVGKVGKTDSEEFAQRRNVRLLETREFASALTGLHVVGGTAWCFSAKDSEGKLDYLFVDEAGQVSVANLTGIARSARNIVLLGDQMQLGQPIQGAHPGESGLSVLDYLLQGHSVIQNDRGIFLDHTWRLHPKLCEIVSGAFYEGQLHSRPGTEANRIEVPKGKSGRVGIDSGLLFIPVPHEGNSQASPEEVTVIQEIINDILGRSFNTSGGKRKGKLGLQDILVVAPYNMQVNAIRRGITGVNVGSVDKFQGQEAPVVILSMCASQGEISTRGIDFLFSKNRLNVAISRAQCLAIVVGCPTLTRSRCVSIGHMELCNAFCRIVHDGKQ